MIAEELVRILDTWSDALNVAEVLSIPHLRVGDSWDLRDWQSVEMANGLKFQRLNRQGEVAEEVVIVDSDTRKEVYGPTPSSVLPTWLLRLSDTRRYAFPRPA